MAEKPSERKLQDIEQRIIALEHGYRGLKPRVDVALSGAGGTLSKNTEADVSYDEHKRTVIRLIGRGCLGTVGALIPIVFAFISALPDACEYQDLRFLYIRGIVTGYYSMLVLGIAGGLCYAFIETNKGRTYIKAPGAFMNAFITAIYFTPVSAVLILSVNGFFAIPSFPMNHDQAAQICAKPLQSEVPR
jgi:hypothetical protein